MWPLPVCEATLRVTLTAIAATWDSLPMVAVVNSFGHLKDGEKGEQDGDSVWFI